MQLVTQVSLNPAAQGKISAKDRRIARSLYWVPWISFLLVSVPGPIIFLFLFFTATTTESAAVYLTLTLLSLGLGLLSGAVIVILTLIYRRYWLRQLRDKLAADGITVDELQWFKSELTSAERETLQQVQKRNPLLADAYSETLASRLTATRIIAKARAEQLKVERRINRARNIVGADTTSLLNDLEVDHARLEAVRREASTRLAEAKARLQIIEASASRAFTQTETDLMLKRLSNSQEHYPLSLEMAKLEQEALREADLAVKSEREPDP